MKLKKPLFTIVVPAYNVEKYVGQCLDSLVHQSYMNHKVIVVDDGSKDQHTGEICKAYAQKYPELITYVYQENRGLGAARNAGLAMVDTEYVGFIDSDDWLPPDYIKTVTDELEIYQSETIDLIFTLPVIYDSVTKGIGDWNDKEAFLDIFYGNNRITSASQDKRMYYLEPSACRRIHRVAFLKKHKFAFPEGVKWEDVYPHFYLLYHAKACLGIKEVGFYYRINTTGQTTAQAGLSRLDMAKVFDDVFKFREAENCDWETTKSMINMLNKFAKWSLDMSDMETRPKLVRYLSDLYKRIPAPYFSRYGKERKHYKKERLFMWAIRKNQYRLLLCDYLPTELMMNVVNKLLRR